RARRPVRSGLDQGRHQPRAERSGIARTAPGAGTGARARLLLGTIGRAHARDLPGSGPGVMTVAIVHDWLTGMRGGEKVLEVLCERYPDAALFTLFHTRGSVSPTIERHRIRTSLLQHLPFASRHYRRYLPLFPLAVGQFKLDRYDLVISSSHCAAKGAPTSG